MTTDSALPRLWERSAAPLALIAAAWMAPSLAVDGYLALLCGFGIALLAGRRGALGYVPIALSLLPLIAGAAALLERYRDNLATIYASPDRIARARAALVVGFDELFDLGANLDRDYYHRRSEQLIGSEQINGVDATCFGTVPALGGCEQELECVDRKLRRVGAR